MNRMLRIARDVHSLNPDGKTWLILPVERLPNGSGNTTIIRGSAEEDDLQPLYRRRTPDLSIGNMLEKKSCLAGNDNRNNKHQ